jgi:hypothetical protein
MLKAGGGERLTTKGHEKISGVMVLHLDSVAVRIMTMFQRFFETQNLNRRLRQEECSSLRPAWAILPQK